MPVKSLRKPTYTLHKPTGQARVRIGRKDHYLGLYGSPRSREGYDELVQEWIARNGDAARYALTVDELALLFMADAEEHYRHSDGTPTRGADNMRDALRPLVRLFGRRTRPDSRSSLLCAMVRAT